MTSTNPWERSLRILERPGRPFAVAESADGIRWEPEAAVNPRRRRAEAFASTDEAVDFVRARLRRIVAGRFEPRVRFRTERMRRHGRREACVLVVGGNFRHPPVYVKWFIDSEDGADRRVVFVSFHGSDRSW
jgi:hypothetical protein